MRLGGRTVSGLGGGTVLVRIGSGIIRYGPDWWGFLVGFGFVGGHTEEAGVEA